ncbi:MAG: response regulator transcription factor [Ferruginibacter sp.]
MANDGKRKICIVEDNDDLREALSLMIQLSDQYVLAGCFSNAEAALCDIPVLEPEAVLMDINLPGVSGIQCIAQLKDNFPKLLFLVCTSFEDNDKIFDSLKAGASGYILKSEGPTKILSALTEMLEGGSPMSSPIARKVVASFKTVDSGKKQLQVLTDREREVLEALSKGLMNKEVAELLQISSGTVRKHVQNIYEKLQVNTRVEALNVYLKEK